MNDDKFERQSISIPERLKGVRTAFTDPLELLAKKQDRVIPQQKTYQQRAQDKAYDSLLHEFYKWRELDQKLHPNSERHIWPESMLIVHWLITEVKIAWHDSPARRHAINRLRVEHKLDSLEIPTTELDYSPDSIDNFSVKPRTAYPAPGDRFNDLTVIEYAGKNGSNHASFKCQCTCGSTRTVALAKLRSGMIRACESCAKARTTESKARAKKQNLYLQLLDTSMLKLPDS